MPFCCYTIPTIPFIDPLTNTAPLTDGTVHRTVLTLGRYSEVLRTQIVDSVTFLHSEVSLGSKAQLVVGPRVGHRGSEVLVEGANAALLDIDFGILVPISAIFDLFDCQSLGHDACSIRLFSTKWQYMVVVLGVLVPFPFRRFLSLMIGATMRTTQHHHFLQALCYTMHSA